MTRQAGSLLTVIAGISLLATGIAAHAEGAADGTKLITLGTAGGPQPRKDRAQASNLLVVNGTLYLIDAGGGVTRRIVQTGYDFRKIGKIFITHPHSDHTAGLATLMVSEWEYQRAEPVDIYGGGVEALVKGAIDYLTPNAEIRWAEGKKRPMADTFHGHDVAARPHLSGRQRQGDGGREHALPFSARQAALRQVQVLFLPLRHARPRRLLHRRYRPVRRRDRIGERRRPLRHRSDVGGRSGRAIQAQRRLAGEDTGRAGRLHPSHARGARHARGGRQDGGEGRRQDDRDDAFRAVGESRTTTINATPTRRRNISPVRSWSRRT